MGIISTWLGAFGRFFWVGRRVQTGTPRPTPKRREETFYYTGVTDSLKIYETLKSALPEAHASVVAKAIGLAEATP